MPRKNPQKKLAKAAFEDFEFSVKRMTDVLSYGEIEHKKGCHSQCCASGCKANEFLKMLDLLEAFGLNARKQLLPAHDDSSDTVFMGAGPSSQADSLHLHILLDAALSELSGREQCDLSGDSSWAKKQRKESEKRMTSSVQTIVRRLGFNKIKLTGKDWVRK